MQDLSRQLAASQGSASDLQAQTGALRSALDNSTLLNCVELVLIVALTVVMVAVALRRPKMRAVRD